MKNTTKLLKEIYYQHDVICNQMYGDYKYSYHLKDVIQKVLIFKKIYPEINENVLILSAAGHDLIEDARMTYNDVKKLLGEEIADIIYACTEEKGKNRKERHSKKFYTELRQNKPAVYIKLCDIISNSLHSIITGSSMINMYKKEFPVVKSYLYKEGEFELLWEILSNILNES